MVKSTAAYLVEYVRCGPCFQHSCGGTYMMAREACGFISCLFRGAIKLYKHPVPDQVKPSFVFFDIQALFAPYGLASCRISPPSFLAECGRSPLNQGSFVVLYFVLFNFSGLYLDTVACHLSF